MANTPNYNLLIPSPTGTEDVHQSLADNFNKIDTGIKVSDDKAQSVKTEVEQARTSPDGSVQPNLQAAIKWVYDNVQQQTLGTEIVPMIGASPDGTKYEISFDDLGGVITTVSTGSVRSLVGSAPNGTRYEITFENDGDIITTVTTLPATTLVGSAPNGNRYDISFENDGDLVTTANETPIYAQTTTEVQAARTDVNNLTSASLKARLDANQTQVATNTANITTNTNQIGILSSFEVNVKKYESQVVSGDWTNAIKAAIQDVSSGLNNAYGQGAKIIFPTGNYKVSSKIRISKSNIILEGAGLNATYIESTITNGDPVFEFTPVDTTQRLWGVGVRNMTIDGKNTNSIGISLKNISLGRFKDFAIRLFGSHGLYMDEVWDTNIEGMYNGGNGNLAGNKHGVFIYNGTVDNTNRVIFLNGHFEANNGSHVYMDSTGNSRRNGNNQFIGCKFHGKDPSALPGNNPATPHMYLDGDVNYIISCYFYQCNSDHIKIKGDRNKVIGCDFYNSTGYFVNITGTSQFNSVTDSSGQYFGAGLYPVNRPTNENFVNSSFIGDGKKMWWGNSAILDQGGRLALFQNLYRSGASFMQPKGTDPSYGVQIAQNTEGVSFLGAQATGTDNSVATLATLLNVALDGIKPKVPVTFTAISATGIPNNSLFVDSADNKLKYKDNTGTVNLLY